MLDQLIHIITSLIITFIETTGYAGIFLLMGLESALIPIPSEVTMMFAGYLASQNKLDFFPVVLVGAFANLVGSWAAYWLGLWGEDKVRYIIRKYGKFVLISESEYEKSERWFRKYGEPIVFFSRILPVIRTFISLPAGIAKMNLMKFTVFTFVGSLIWSALLTYGGFVLGKNWNSIEVYYRKFEYLIIFAGVAVAAYYVFHKIKKLRHRKG